MKTLPAVDAVIVGGGWAGLLMAKELGSRTALSVVVLERGPSRGSSEYINDMDELDYAIRLHMMQDLSQETWTFRHADGQRALPIRQFGSFLPGTGIGGAGEHWGGVIDRMMPHSFKLLSNIIEKYGANRLPEGHSIQDWPLTYDELEPFYARAERLIGASGKAGNLHGKLIEGGNIFEGPRSTEYPTPPNKISYFASLFLEATKSLGYHPFPYPGATLSTSYKNPDGVERTACIYCGFCERYGCMVDAKAQPSNTFLPVIQRHKNVAVRTGAAVRRIVHDGIHGNGHAHGVTYMNSHGEEIFQPAELVVLSSWTLNNTRLLLLSDAGEPYDPAAGKGTLGRNLTHQVSLPAATAFMEKPLNRFMGSGASGIMIADLDADRLDHANPFLHGGIWRAPSHGFAPIANFGVLPRANKARWGSEWKKQSLHYYDRTGSIQFSGEHLAYKGNFMDLDPTYRDRFGDPLIRLTLDWRDNERKLAEFAAAKAVEIAWAMGAKEVNPFPGYGHYEASRYQGTHLQGGTIMGTSPEVSVVNPYLQHWQLPNLFVVGASSFPQNPSSHPTLVVLALALRTADAIIRRYLKKPGSLA